MPCPFCRFPGNDPAATVCANCGTSLALAYPGSPAAGAPPSAPMSPQYPPAHPGGGYPGGAYGPGSPVAGQFPMGMQGAGQYPAGPPGSPVAGQYPAGAPGSPVAGAYPAGMPVSPTPISVTPISGGPQPEYYGPVKAPRSRVLVPLTVIVVVLVIASTVIAVVKLTGGSGAQPGPTQAAGGGGSATSTVNAPGGGGATASGGAQASGGASKPAGGDPAAQAAAVDAILDASVSSRTKLNAAIDLVGRCTLIDKAIADMQTVGAERQSQIDSVARFDLAAIQEGEQLRGMLKEALGFSLAADRSFVPWAQAQQSSRCAGGSGQSDYDEAQRQSRSASDAKNRFLGVWNPVAGRYGLRNRSSNDI